MSKLIFISSKKFPRSLKVIIPGIFADQQMLPGRTVQLGHFLTGPLRFNIRIKSMIKEIPFNDSDTKPLKQLLDEHRALRCKPPYLPKTTLGANLPRRGIFSPLKPA